MGDDDEPGTGTGGTDGGQPAGSGDSGNDGGDGQDSGAGTGQDSGRSGNDAMVAQLRREAAKHRTEARQAQAKLAELENRDLSERDRLAKENASLQERVQASERRALEATISAQVASAAHRLGIVDVDAAVKLLPQLEIDDDGLPVGVDDALTGLLEQRPWLKAGGGNGGDGDGGRRTPPPAGRPANPSRSQQQQDTEPQPGLQTMAAAYAEKAQQGR